MKSIVTDTYDFPTLIEYGYVYVDKTALLRRMVSGVDGRFFFMKMAGADITPELESSEGRADAVVETERTVCIFEFKYGRTAKLALRQITAKRYADAFASDTRRIVSVGVNYNPKNGQVEVACGEVNGEVNSGSGEVNGKVNSTRGEVNAYVAAHPGCRRKEMTEALSVSARTLDRNLAALIAEGRLEFRGAPKNGGYYPVKGCLRAKRGKKK